MYLCLLYKFWLHFRVRRKAVKLTATSFIYAIILCEPRHELTEFANQKFNYKLIRFENGMKQKWQ